MRDKEGNIRSLWNDFVKYAEEYELRRGKNEAPLSSRGDAFATFRMRIDRIIKDEMDFFKRNQRCHRTGPLGYFWVMGGKMKKKVSELEGAELDKISP